MYALNPRSDFVHINGIRLHYLDWGGTGPTLIFLTGMGCSAYIFNKFAPRFADAFHVLALTRRGQGDSDYPEAGYDADTLTEDIRQFMDSLNIEKAILALCHLYSTSSIGENGLPNWESVRNQFVLSI